MYLQTLNRNPRSWLAESVPQINFYGTAATLYSFGVSIVPFLSKLLYPKKYISIKHPEVADPPSAFEPLPYSAC